MSAFAKTLEGVEVAFALQLQALRFWVTSRAFAA